MSKASEREIAAAAAYESLHVPALFQQWAPIVADAADLGPGDRVLDVACGTGILTREARDRVGDGGSVAGLDATSGMLAVAEDIAPDISWHHGMAESLPFAEHAFDAVVSQFGLMFFRDRAAAVSEMLRVLARDGRLAVAVWESLERSEAYPVEVDLLERLAGREAADALRAPFALGHKQRLHALFDGAGFDAVSIETHHGTARFPSIRAMVEADLRGWLPVMGVHLDEALIERILGEAESAMSPYLTAEGSVAFDAPAHVLTAQRSSQ